MTENAKHVVGRTEENRIYVGLHAEAIKLKDFDASREGYQEAVAFVGTLANADQGIFYIDVPGGDPERLPSRAELDPDRTVDVQFTPYVSVRIGGTTGEPVVERITIDWFDTCQGEIDPEKGASMMTGTPAELAATRFMDIHAPKISDLFGRLVPRTPGSLADDDGDLDSLTEQTESLNRELGDASNALDQAITYLDRVDGDDEADEDLVGAAIDAHDNAIEEVRTAVRTLGETAESAREIEDEGQAVIAKLERERDRLGEVAEKLMQEAGR